MIWWGYKTDSTTKPDYFITLQCTEFSWGCKRSCYKWLLCLKKVQSKEVFTVELLPNGSYRQSLSTCLLQGGAFAF